MNAFPSVLNDGTAGAATEASARALGHVPPVLALDAVSVRFPGARQAVPAVDGVTLQLRPAEVLAIIGESGSGKSTLARTVMGLVPGARGSLHLDDEPLPILVGERTRAQRRALSMVFQDSAASFDPRFTVADILREPLALLDRTERQNATPLPQVLAEVGLPTAVLSRRPHELSGGQRQRIGIARALVSNPRILICDEAVSALDVSVQAQILNLLSELQVRRSLAFLFITHDLGVVEYFADRIGVMRGGRLLECGDAADVLDRPRHPYTRELFSSMSHALADQGRE